MMKKSVFLSEIVPEPTIAEVTTDVKHVQTSLDQYYQVKKSAFSFPAAKKKDEEGEFSKFGLFSFSLWTESPTNRSMSELASLLSRQWAERLARKVLVECCIVWLMLCTASSVSS